MRTRLASSVAALPPSAFALVMATGIVSIALDLEGYRAGSLTLLAIAAASFAVLTALTVWRLRAFRERVREDFRDPGCASGFFTFVAGTNVLAACLAGEGAEGPAAGLLLVAGLAWLALGYLIPWSAVLGRAERPVLRAANGSWFVSVVAAQSVAVVAAALEPSFPDMRQALALVAVLAWSVGVCLYGASAVCVALRLMLYPAEPRDVDPTLWISMGSLAITVVAGARIVQMDAAPMVDATGTLIAGTSVVVWCFATWLIPALVAMGWWRHRVHGVPLTYGVDLWSIIFPLGMYSVASTYLGRVDDLPVVERIGGAWLWVAVVAWAVTFAAMLRHLARTLLRDPPPDATA